MDTTSKIGITILLAVSYGFLKFAFPLVFDVFKSVMESINPRFANKFPGYFDVAKRLPDILGIGLLCMLIIIWLT